MKVINGKDYWDNAAYYGVDETLTFVRNPNRNSYDFISREYFFPLLSYKDYTIDKYRILPLGVIFASGKSYPFAFHTSSDPINSKTRTVYNMIPSTVIYSVDELSQLHPDMNKKSYWGSEINHYKRFANQKKFSEKNVTDFLMQHNAATALILPETLTYGGWGYRMGKDDPKCGNSMVWINPSFLKEFEFYKIKDSFTMFMEISNWVGGVLPTTIETVEISDNSKIIKAGFDVKNSFRKAKQ